MHENYYHIYTISLQLERGVYNRRLLIHRINMEYFINTVFLSFFHLLLPLFTFILDHARAEYLGWIILGTALMRQCHYLVLRIEASSDSSTETMAVTLYTAISCLGKRAIEYEELPQINDFGTTSQHRPIILPDIKIALA